MARKQRFTKSDVLKAIKDSYGLISEVAKRLHCEWHTAKKYIEKWQDTELAFIDEEETKLDFVESKAIKAIEKDDSAMIRFYLATKGKKRGFSYNKETDTQTTQKDDPQIYFVFDNDDTEPKSV